MNFLARIIRFLFWVLVVSWSVALLRRLVNWMLRGAIPTPESSATTPPDDTAARKLVRDPVCGVHVAEVLAIPLREDGELLQFCSTACRDQYVDSTKRFVASA
jgi:YHS domain-containing protein